MSYGCHYRSLDFDVQFYCVFLFWLRGLLVNKQRKISENSNVVSFTTRQLPSGLVWIELFNIACYCGIRKHSKYKNFWYSYTISLHNGEEWQNGVEGQCSVKGYVLQWVDKGWWWIMHDGPLNERIFHVFHFMYLYKFLQSESVGIILDSRST